MVLGDEHAVPAAAAAAAAGAAGQHHHHQRSFEADRLRERWCNIFRAEHNMLYDILMWRKQDWPIMSLQWQPTAWQPPEWLLQQQQQAAAAAVGEALIRGWTPEAVERMSGAGADDMDVESPAGAAAAVGSDAVGDIDSEGREVVALPIDYQYLLLGQQGGDEEQRHVQLCRVGLPGSLPAGFDPGKQRLLMVKGGMTPVMAIPHGRLDVNKLHVMPSNLNIMATCCDEPQIYLFDLSKQQQQQQRQQHRIGSSNSSGSPEDTSSVCSDSQEQQEVLAAVLSGRSAGGYALEWNPNLPGVLLSGDLEGAVQLWDVQRGSSSGSGNGSGTETGSCPAIQPFQVCPAFAGCAINDVSWHASGTTFAAATERGQLLLQDVRCHNPVAVAAGPCSSSAAAAAGSALGFSTAALRSAQVHVRRDRAGQDAAAPDCLTVEFDPNTNFRLATGGKDGYVCILDMRKLSVPLQRLAMHAGDVKQVSWSSGAPGLLASAGEDGHVLLWDVHKMKHAARQQQQQRQQQKAGASAAAAASGTSRAAAAAAAAGASDGGLGLSKPQKTKYTEHIARMTNPGLLFPHHGHLGPVEQITWNPDRPWMLASASAAALADNGAGEDEEVQPNIVMVWEVNRSHGLLC